MSIRLRAGAEDNFPRSSADFDHGFREIFLKSPSPRDGGRTEYAGLRGSLEVGELSSAVVVRESERSSTDLSINVSHAGNNKEGSVGYLAAHLLANGMLVATGSGRNLSRIGRGSVG